MRIEELFEAKISGANIGSAMTKIIGYLERHMGFKLRKLGVETFHNSAEEGRGVRYLEDGTLNCIRFNWAGSNSAEIISVDLWNGTSHDPNFNIEFKGVSLAQSLPALVKVLKAPKVGHVPVTKEALSEAKKGEFTPESAVADMIEKLESGRSFNRSEFIMAYHPENAFAYDEFVEKFADDLVLAGKRISIPKGEKLKGSKKTSKGSADGELIVTKGGSGEEYESDEVQRLEKEDHVSFSESIEHLQGLTTALIKGSTNAIFVAGKGGTGKTQTIEDTLAAQGLTDGGGYYKITGSASPIGIYSMLYKYRKGIIVFDDCDGALESQDGRNIIKAATDTKKIRKIAWGKKSAGMFDPDSEPQREDPAEGEDDLDADDDRIPKHFNFEGRVIFISNLPLNKLDPDGALRTRAFIINIDPTAKEMLERMEEIMDDIKLEAGHLNHKERVEVLDVIKGSKRKDQASLRTLVRALNLAASGAPNWQRLVALYS